jgi:hypothetical protein
MTLDDFIDTDSEEEEPILESVNLDPQPKNDEAWSTIFDKLQVLNKIESQGSFEISAEQIKTIGKREPRLMAKIESINTEPKIFRENKLCIMPCKSRGNYTIGHYDAFLNVDYENATVKMVENPKRFDMLNPYDMSKEPSVILAAKNYGILDKIAGEEVMMTDFGRESTEPFTYHINDLTGKDPHQISVDKSQLEMDGVFESDSYIINIEAKMGLREDFLARQLYYPYRLIQGKTNKEIINAFITHSIGSTYVHAFKIKDVNDYNSFETIGNYRFDYYEPIRIDDIKNILKTTIPEKENEKFPFPQADTIQKVFDSMEIMKKTGGVTQSELGYLLSVKDRQGGYYSNACAYLGLAEISQTKPYKYTLSSYGEELLNSPLKKRMLGVIRAIASHDVLNHFLKEYLEQYKPPELSEIEAYIAENVPKVNKGTPHRRAQTVSNWIAWIMNLPRADN